MLRERTLQVILVLVGLFFLVVGVAGLYGELWNARWLLPSHNEVTAMFASLYFTLGIFVLLAAKAPGAYRTLVAFAAWSSLAHAAVMGVQAAQAVTGRRDFIQAAIVFGAIGIVLLGLAPVSRRVARASAA